MPAALVRNLPRSTRTPALPHPSARFFGLKLALMPATGECRFSDNSTLARARSVGRAAVPADSGAIFPALSFEWLARPKTAARLSAGTAARPTQFLLP